MSATPKINPRNFQKLLDERKSIIPFYTPEWDISDENEAGFALLKIFTHMQEDIVSRLNRIPEKNFAAFLEMLGIKLVPAQPARVPATFYLSEGLAGGVFVPARTQVATEETEKHKALVFETTKNFFATSAAIEEVYCVDKEKDKIFCYSDDFKNKKEFVIFGEESNGNLQKHILYLGHDDLFNLKNPAIIKLKFELSSGSMEELANLDWCYWGDDEKTPIEFEVLKNEINKNIIILKKPEGEIKKKKINGKECRWIFCNSGKEKSIVISRIRIIDVNPKVTAGAYIKPDIGFYNYIPLDTSKEFYPFGEQPRLFDTFYLASKEAFSKKNAKIKITFTIKAGEPYKVAFLWEYWDGALWQLLKGIDGNVITAIFEKKDSQDLTVEFYCPEIKEFEVNGERNYWIRVRLIRGDYGKEIVELIYTKQAGSVTTEGWAVKSDYKPPLLSIGIEYSLTNEFPPFDLQHCIAYNNQEFRDFTAQAGFKPFIPLPENQPTLYLGFKEPFKKGNISIFFSLKDREYPPHARPKIEWTYWSTASNLLDIDGLEVKLGSIEGISVGTELLFEESSDSETITEVAKVKSISDSDKKITLENRLDHKFKRNARVFKRTYLEVIDNTEYLTKTETLEFAGPPEQFKTHKFGKESYWLMGTIIKSANEPTLIKGIYPNTVWVEQVETIKDELLGSSNGEKNQGYNFIKSPVISPEIWVQRGEIVSEDEKEQPAEKDILEIKDEKGNIWVRWKVVEDFMASDPRSRHCVVDSSMGRVDFGDGKNGMIPPIGKDNIKANYKSGGGVVGNVMRNEITVLKTPVAGIDHVINHENAEGGSDTELLTEVFERGPHSIKHLERAVTVEDFERIAREASSYIARTKCIIESNRLRIIVIPKGEEDKPLPSSGLKKIVKKHLLQRSLNLVRSENIDVSDPRYREVKVTADVIPKSIEDAIPLEKEILKRLKEYLHPLTGGNEKKGWEFGRGVHISDIYTMLEGIEGVDHVENLKLNGDSYLFCWNSIPGNDDDRLLKFLKHNLNISLVGKVELEKKGDTILISIEEKKIELKLDENRERAILKIDNDRTYNLLAKREDGKLNLYSKDLYIEEAETVCSGDHRITMKLGG